MMFRLKSGSCALEMAALVLVGAKAERSVVCVTGENDIALGLEIMHLQADTAKNGRLIVVPDC